jgi:hypothetical protein
MRGVEDKLREQDLVAPFVNLEKRAGIVSRKCLRDQSR